jgi:hypothetical protein
VGIAVFGAGSRLPHDHRVRSVVDHRVDSVGVHDDCAHDPAPGQRLCCETYFGFQTVALPDDEVHVLDAGGVGVALPEPVHQCDVVLVERGDIVA